MRRRTILLAVAGAALLLGACSGGDDEPTPPAGASTEVPTATPFPTTPVPTIVTSETPSGTEGPESTYTVEPGDTLSALAQEFDTTVEALQEANDLSGVDIFVGQELVIPGEGSGGAADGGDEPTSTPEPEATATPEPEDTATPEAEETATPEPDGEETATPTPDGGGDTGDTQTYVVEAGDNAIGIADEFGITLEELAAANGMTVDELDDIQIGQELQIPPAE